MVSQTPWPSATEQATLLLSYIAQKAPTRGAPVTVNHNKDYPLFFAKGREDVSFLARELINAGSIKRTDVGAIPRHAMTMRGYEELERRQRPAQAPAPEPPMPALTDRTPVALTQEGKPYDLFLSHASEEKVAVADPLHRLLTEAGCRVWYDKAVLTMGDSLRRKIDRGLRMSRFGVVILSPSFFAKNWPQQELDGLAAREIAEGRKVILPVWHKVTRSDVLRQSPTLADTAVARSRLRGAPALTAAGLPPAV